MLRKRDWLTLVCGAIVLLAGCGGGPNASITGNVTLDGQPLPTGTIDFIPADGNTPTASALIENGTYTLDLFAGPKQVKIHSIKVVGKKPTYEGMKDSPMSDVTEEVVPEKFNKKTTLTVDVANGENQKDFALTSK